MGILRVNQYNPIIEQKINKKDCTLEELLDDDIILTEIKNSNPKVHIL